MPCQLFIWLRRRVMGTDRQTARPGESLNLPPAHASTHAPIHLHPQDHPPPPSYDNLFPCHPDGTEDLETVRSRHPPKRPLQAPMPTDSPIEAAYLASVTAATGYVAGAQDETHPCMIAARIAQAISIAASASNSHAALLAAVNAVELLAMLEYDMVCGRAVVRPDDDPRIILNLIDTAARRALAEVPPSNSFDPHDDPQSVGLIAPDMTRAHRALQDVLFLNPHIIPPSQQ